QRLDLAEPLLHWDLHRRRLLFFSRRHWSVLGELCPHQAGARVVSPAIGTSNGAPALMIWGQVGRATTVRYASGIAPTPQWFSLTNFNLPSSPFRLVDWNAVNSQQRFYQTVQ